MKRWLYLCGAAALLVGAALVNNRADAQAEKLTVKEIMGRVNKGPTALFPTIRKELNADAPAWDALQRQSKELASLVEALGQKDPPRGEKMSWVQFAKSYAENARALDTAAQKKDKGAMLVAHAKITDACSACHKAHRPN